MTNGSWHRDFLGYGDKRPDPQWPDGARVALSFVLNVEEGAEFAVTTGDERNEAVYEIVDEVAGAADPCMESHFEYGPRAGYSRIMHVLRRFEVPVTLNVCGRALEAAPWLGRDAVGRGHEIAAHGYRWESHAGMEKEYERKVIRRTVEAIRSAVDVRPIGWHTRCLVDQHPRPAPRGRRIPLF